jgi:hypothetical protein
VSIEPVALGLELSSDMFLRLCCNEQWRPESEGFGHAYMIQDMKKEPKHQFTQDLHGATPQKTAFFNHQEYLEYGISMGSIF